MQSNCPPTTTSHNTTTTYLYTIHPYIIESRQEEPTREITEQHYIITNRQQSPPSHDTGSDPMSKTQQKKRKETSNNTNKHTKPTSGSSTVSTLARGHQPNIADGSSPHTTKKARTIWQASIGHYFTSRPFSSQYLQPREDTTAPSDAPRSNTPPTSSTRSDTPVNGPGVAASNTPTSSPQLGNTILRTRDKIKWAPSSNPNKQRALWMIPLHLQEITVKERQSGHGGGSQTDMAKKQLKHIQTKDVHQLSTSNSATSPKQNQMAPLVSSSAMLVHQVCGPIQPAGSKVSATSSNNTNRTTLASHKSTSTGPKYHSTNGLAKFSSPRTCSAT
jgi:hypothetical protein